MKHDKSVEFMSAIRMSSPPHNANPPYWKLSGDGSELDKDDLDLFGK